MWAGVVVTLLFTSCQPATSLDRGPITTVILTRDGADDYRYDVAADGRVDVRALPSNRSGNLRVAGIRPSDPQLDDVRVCVTWIGFATALAQPGVVARLRVDGDRVRAIAVTNNVVFGYRRAFNVHLIDTGGSPVLRQLASFPMPWADAPSPWRVCAEAREDIVSVHVWPLADPEPAWGTPGHGGSVRLPPTWVVSGSAGWFAGHLIGADRLAFRDVQVGRASAGGGPS